jgi:hypothetical protein
MIMAPAAEADALPPPSDDPLPLNAVTTRYRGSLIALSHKHHDRADLFLGGKPQLSYRS